jgi:hypothetical protein
MVWITGAIATFCLLMTLLTIDEQGPTDWYGNPIEEEPDPLRVVCPKCLARVGAGCVHPNGKPTLTHVRRKIEAV